MNIPTFRLDGRCAVVTGAASGIGRAAAEGLAHYGADVVISELPSKLPSAQAVAEEIARTHGRKVYALPLELPKLDSIQAFTKQAAEKLGRIDILVNNAGVQIPKYALDVTEEDWDRVVDVNLKGSFFIAQAVAR
ncbi:MAG TPA: SDR family NAD(P)-dependent oxidoreductase, partial [Planctomycetota bacterium]|nr:SDR family NAD(P)-dependent oxidoreductase [Planctomycetota bacterium]